MHSVRSEIKLDKLSYPLGNFIPLEESLFLKIETTGYTAKNTVLYLIGAAYYQDGNWYCRQWFASEPAREREVLESFFEFSRNYKHLFHFNGNNYDLPFILDKCKEYNLPYDFEHLQGTDIYKRVSAVQSFLHLHNCKQRTLLAFLGIDEPELKDINPNINLYHEYLSHPNDEELQVILQRNRESISDMFKILPMLSYYDIFGDKTEVIKVQARTYTDMGGKSSRELFMKLKLPAPVPKEVSSFFRGCYFTAGEDVGAIKVPIFDGELKYYYSNYRDYYYLPGEDMAIHKSIAVYGNKDSREQARADTCYTRKTSAFLPQWADIIRPVFMENIRDKVLYFEITPQLKTNRALFKEYARHILSIMRDGDNSKRK